MRCCGVLTLVIVAIVVVVAAALLRGTAGARERRSAIEHDRHANEVLESARARAEAEEPGGDPGNAIVVQSPAVVEPNAQERHCSRCDARHRVLEHRAEIIDGVRLRVAEIECRRCGHRRRLYYRLPRALVN